MMKQGYYDDDDRSFNQPDRAPFDKELAYEKKPTIYMPPYFFATSASVIFALIGMIFFFIAFGGPVWYVVPPENTVVPKTFGLWRLCVRTECVVDMTNDYMIKRYLVDTAESSANEAVIYAFENYLMPCKVLMCIGVIFCFIMMSANIAFIAGLPTFFIEAVAQMFVGLLTAVTVGIFGGNFRDDKHTAPFGWSYWCGVVATMILIVNGSIMMFISLLVYRKRGGFTRK